MEIILDADVVIRGEKGSFDLAGWLDSRGDDSLSLAAITVAELWHGVERAAGTRRRLREQFLQAILDVLPVIPYTEQTAFFHAKLWAELLTAGKMIGYYDLIVAATALEWNYAVATFNRRHFAVVPGLNVIEPSTL